MSQDLEQMLDDYDHGKVSRRALIGMLAALTVAPAKAEKPQGFKATSLNHVTLAVADIERSRRFYEEVLGVSVVSTQKNGINMGLGDSFLGLYKIDSPPRIHHFCVGLDEYEVNASAERLRGLGIDPYVRPDKPEVYFQDPDGISVQLEDKRYRG